MLGSKEIYNLITFLIDRHDKKFTPEQRAIRNLLARDLLIDLKSWKHADERTADEWEIIENNFLSYEELGGNGKIKKLFTECSEIPTTE